MPNTLPGVSTIGKIRQLVVDEGYQPPQSVNSGYVGNSPFDMLNRFINQSYQEFIGVLITRYEDYYINEPQMPFRFFTDGKNWQFPLPDDYDKLLGVDYYTTSNSIQTAVSLKSFMNAERNDYSYPYVPVVPGGLWARYRITGNVIEFQPRPPPANMQIGVKYVPAQIQMTDVITITCTGVTSNDQLIIWTGPQIPTTGGVFPVPPTNSQSYFPSLNTQVVNGVTIPALVNKQTFTAHNIVPPSLPSPGFFAVGANDFITAQNIANALQTYYPSQTNAQTAAPPWSVLSAALDSNIVQVTAVGNQVIIQLIAPICMIVQSYNLSTGAVANSFAIDPLPVPSFMNPYGAVSNFCPVLTGFDEYIVADVCEKILRREERDFTPYAMHKQEVWARLKMEAQNRDANLPFRTTNVNRRGGNGGGSGFGY